MWWCILHSVGYEVTSSQIVSQHGLYVDLLAVFLSVEMYKSMYLACVCVLVRVYAYVGVYVCSIVFCACCDVNMCADRMERCYGGSPDEMDV